MKTATLPWLAITSLTIEGAALLLITLALTCPAPFESSSLSLLVIHPGSAMQTNTTWSLPANSTQSASPSQSTTTALNATTTAPIPTTAVSLAVDQTANSSKATTSASASPTSTTMKRRGRKERRQEPAELPSVQLESLPAPNITSSISNYTAASPSLNASILDSKILLRIGPLGSCFRTSDNIETCTPAKLNSKYNYSVLQGADITTDGLPDGMSTFPLLLLLIVIFLLIKVATGIAVLVAPQSLVPTLMTSITCAWQVGANWLVFLLLLVLCIASGVEKNKLSGAADSFNTANEAKSIDTIPLMAETGTSFGFIWISAALLLTSFLFKRRGIKKEAAVERAKSQLDLHYAHQNGSSNFYLDHQQKAIINEEYPVVTAKVQKPQRASSAMTIVRNLLPTTTTAARPPARQPEGTPTMFAVPTMVLDEYPRNHQQLHKTPSLSHFGYQSDHQMHPPDAPPFSSYQDIVDDQLRARDANGYVDEARQKMSSPAPSYWTSADRAHEFQIRREKERRYMAELRRQRSARD